MSLNDYELMQSEIMQNYYAENNADLIGRRDFKITPIFLTSKRYFDYCNYSQVQSVYLWCCVPPQFKSNQFFQRGSIFCWNPQKKRKKPSLKQLTVDKWFFKHALFY